MDDNHKNTITTDLNSITKYISEKNWLNLKLLVRSRGWSIDDEIRNDLWYLLAKSYAKSDIGNLAIPQALDHDHDQQCNANSSVQSLENAKQENMTLKSGNICRRKLPVFIEQSYCRFYHLSYSLQLNLEQVICSLAHDHPEITFCPLLYPMAALFLHFHTPKQVYQVLSILLDVPASGHHVSSPSTGQCLLPQTRTQMIVDAYILIKLTNQFGLLPQRRFFAEQRKRLKEENHIDVCFADWLKWIFIGLPYEHCVRIMDCFLVEGAKFLFRIGLALLLLYKKNNFPTSGFIYGAGLDPGSEFRLDKMLSFCEKITLSPNELIRYALQITRLGRSKINYEYKKAEISVSKNILASPHSVFGLSVSDSEAPKTPQKSDMLSFENLKITTASRVPPTDLNSSILNYELLELLWDWFPDKTSVRNAKVIFSINEDGNSLSTFFMKTCHYEPTVLIVKNEEDEIFGAYCSTAWEQRHNEANKSSSNHYFGTGETFLFRLFPKAAYYPWIGTKDYANASHLVSFSPLSVDIPHSSQLFLSADGHMISIGAGNGIGLWVDENLTNGTTSRCDTFDNDPLASKSTFRIASFEVIAFD